MQLGFILNWHYKLFPPAIGSKYSIKNIYCAEIKNKVKKIDDKFQSSVFGKFCGCLVDQAIENFQFKISSTGTNSVFF